MRGRSIGILIATGALIAMAAAPASTQPGNEGTPWFKRVFAGCLGEPSVFHPCALAKIKTFEPKKTADGKPDMTGFWYGGPANSMDIEAHVESAGLNAGPSLIVDPPDGKIPYKPWALAQRTKNLELFSDPHASCFPSGVPRMMYAAFGYQIIQTPGYFVASFLFNHVTRVIPTDGRPHIAPAIQLWQADSRGHWEGNTLVIDTTNQNNDHWLDAAGNFWGANTHVVERISLLTADALHYEARITDPGLYTKPWTLAYPIRRNMEKDYEQWEYACHEGEMNTQHMRNLGRKSYKGTLPPE